MRFFLDFFAGDWERLIVNQYKVYAYLANLANNYGKLSALTNSCFHIWLINLKCQKIIKRNLFLFYNKQKFNIVSLI